MKNISTYIMTAVAAIALPCAASMSATDPEHTETSDSERTEEYEQTDSLDYGIMALSDDEGAPTFFRDVIPPSPQAAAIARYAEYPVNHTTGIPDISVPLECTPFGTVRTTVSTYTYYGEPVKTTVTGGSVTVVTENTYDTNSGLLKATDVTVNGTKQRVAALTYDDLGRISKVTRGAGSVSYTYTLHGQTKSIAGPGFSQNLFYADGTGTKLYNGSVSSMTWTMGADNTVRGYRYAYNAYGWLTSADYGEGTSLTSSKDRYTEKSTAFTRNGGVTKLQRYGLTAAGTYGKVDDLTVSYSGNRPVGVSDAAPAVTQNGSMDFPGGTTSKVLGYATVSGGINEYDFGARQYYSEEA